MFYRLKNRFRRNLFNRRCAGVLSTPPLRLDPDSELIVLSQMCHRDMILYLLAIKSFSLRLPIGRAVVVNDGSLTSEDIARLQSHVPGIEILNIGHFSSEHCPRGGTWERLLAISDLAREGYVIQLDSDTLAIDDLSEVRSNVEQGIGFTIGTRDGQTLEPMAERSRLARRRPETERTHVQVVAEANFDRLQGFEEMRYVRGCSGFAGFPKGSCSRYFIESASRQMFDAIGDKWSEWGSEQVMSNIVVANTESSAVLPHPRYSNCIKMRPDSTVFIHFIGDCRFTAGVYASHGRRVIQSLVQAG